MIIKNLQIRGFNVGVGGENCSNVKILWNNITSSIEGMHFSWSFLITVSGNIIAENGGNGILFENCSNCTISGNNVTANYCGIRIQHSNNNIVYRNHVAKNSMDGIRVEFSSSRNIILQNYWQTMFMALMVPPIMSFPAIT